MPGRKFVFTNGDRTHAQRCLRLMGLDDCFEVQPRVHLRMPLRVEASISCSLLSVLFKLRCDDVLHA